MSVSSNVVIMTREEFRANLDESFQKGVKRGRFEESCDQSQAKATEGKAGMAEAECGLVRRSTAGTGLQVGEASADLPATSEIMDVTAGETAPISSDPIHQSAAQDEYDALADYIEDEIYELDELTRFEKHHIINALRRPPAPVAADAGWHTMETAPRDGTKFWGLIENDCIAMFWHPGFERFVSSFRRMTMAAGYTINGKSFEDHSPTTHDPKYWKPLDLPVPPAQER